MSAHYEIIEGKIALVGPDLPLSQTVSKLIADSLGLCFVEEEEVKSHFLKKFNFAFLAGALIGSPV